MAEVTQEQVEEALKGFIDPHLEKDLVAAKAVKAVADELGVEMPICHQIYRILYEGASAREAVGALMSRQLKSESDHADQ